VPYDLAAAVWLEAKATTFLLVALAVPGGRDGNTCT